MRQAGNSTERPVLTALAAAVHRCPVRAGFAVRLYLRTCSQCWLATVQLVLQADWQEVWHSPQALPETGALMEALMIVLIWGHGYLLNVAVNAERSE